MQMGRDGLATVEDFAEFVTAMGWLAAGWQLKPLGGATTMGARLELQGGGGINFYYSKNPAAHGKVMIDQAVPNKQSLAAQLAEHLPRQDWHLRQRWRASTGRGCSEWGQHEATLAEGPDECT